MIPGPGGAAVVVSPAGTAVDVGTKVVVDVLGTGTLAVLAAMLPEASQGIVTMGEQPAVAMVRVTSGGNAPKGKMKL